MSDIKCTLANFNNSNSKMSCLPSEVIFLFSNCAAVIMQFLEENIYITNSFYLYLTESYLGK